MLTSLFGDLRAARDTKAKSSDFEDTQVVGASQARTKLAPTLKAMKPMNMKRPGVRRWSSPGRPVSSA